MATPTPSTNTPQKHLAALSSPAPRSVPPMNFDSPAVLNMLSEGGVGMGISMSGMGMSQLGLTASQMGRADEDERRRRLESIISMLNKKPGRVGEEGIIALCKKEGVGFDREVAGDGSVTLTLLIGNEAMCDIRILNGDVASASLDLISDDDNIFKESGSRILLKSLTPRPGHNKINLMLDRFANNLEMLLRMEKLGAENGGLPCHKAIFKVYASLKKLFDHEKKMALALMDENTPDVGFKAEREVLCKKSGRPRMNAGMCLGLSLEYWMDRRHLITKKSQNSSSLKGKEKMDIDSQNAEEYPEDRDPDNNKIYSLTIECESASSSIYTPIRIPDSWISDTVEKPSDAPSDALDAEINKILMNAPQIDWLDPKPTYLEPAASTGDDALNLDSTPGRLPNIRFVAKFNPPITVPFSIYVTIMQSVGLEYNPADIRPTTFVGLALRPGETDPGTMNSAGGNTPEVQSQKTVLALDKDGKEILRTHSNSLYIPKLEFSRTLESLPFQHPRQLVELLPTLRQYAFITSLLQDTFGSKTPTPPLETTTTARPSPFSPPLLPKPTTSPETPPLQLDLSLAFMAPSPRLTLHIPHPSSAPSKQDTQTPTDLLAQLLSLDTPPTKTPLKVVLDMLPNAEIFVSEQNVVPQHAAMTAIKDENGMPQGEGGVSEMQQAAKIGEKVKRVGRALDVCGDLGVWAEWVAREHASF